MSEERPAAQKTTKLERNRQERSLKIPQYNAIRAHRRRKKEREIEQVATLRPHCLMGARCLRLRRALEAPPPLEPEGILSTVSRTGAVPQKILKSRGLQCHGCYRPLNYLASIMRESRPMPIEDLRRNGGLLRGQRLQQSRKLALDGLKSRSCYHRPYRLQSRRSSNG